MTRDSIVVPTGQTSFFTRLRKMVSSKNPPQQLLVPRYLLPTPPATPSRGLEQVFHHFDENGDGKISPVELHKCMKASAEKLSLEEAEEVVRSLDSDKDGLLSIDEFILLLEGQEENERSLREAFGAYEMEGRGCITPKSLKRELERLGNPTTVKECRKMIQKFDIDGDGVISFEEFSIMMTTLG